MTPLQKWTEAAAQFEPRRLPPHSSWVELVGQKTDRKIERGTIRIFGMRYSSPEFLRHAHALDPGERVTVRYDSGDISTITVVDYESGRTFEARCSSRLMREYSNGLSEHAHRVIRHHAIGRRANSDEGHLQIKELLAAKAELVEIADAMLKRKRNKGMHTRLARFMESFSKIYEGVEEVEVFDGDAVENAVMEDGADPAAKAAFDHWNSPSPERETADQRFNSVDARGAEFYNSQTPIFPTLEVD
jgi:alkylated DNA nucleotide flippase Atl1